MGEALGNFYGSLYEDSGDVAAVLAAPGMLASVVGDLNAHHAVFGGAGSSVPAWLADSLINSMSHFRSVMWFADGRWRQWEAYDCPDVDSVHNDAQRRLPYAILFPFSEEQKMKEWASGQGADGMIQEYLASFNLGPMDQPGGRTMADVTTIWLLNLLDIYRNTGDVEFLQELWPVATAAFEWQAGQAAPTGLPQHLVCTYDILDLQVYNTTTFNGMVHLAAMLAVREMATAVGDAATAAHAHQVYQYGVAATYGQLWNSTHDYFRAYTGGDAVMADSLYGAMYGHHVGLGFVVNNTHLAKHLAAELQYNGNAYGLTVVTGRSLAESESAPVATVAQGRRAVAAAVAATGRTAPAPLATGVDNVNDVIWMGGGPDWSYMALALGLYGGKTGWEAALVPAFNEVFNYRDRLHDLWNVAGIYTTGDWGADNVTTNGQPYVTAHYGFHMTQYYLIYALSGQQTDLPAGKLSFAPVMPAPYSLPVVLYGGTGTLVATTSGRVTLSLAFGSLSLPAGGLSVAGVAYSGAVTLQAGQSVTWQL
jgi:non-lysosomal glucosylceramidase